MLNKIRSLLLGLSLITIAGLMALYLYVQMGKGEAIFGGSDGTLPPTDFTALSHPNDDDGYLLCDESLCEGSQADGPAATFPVSATALRQAIVDFSDGMPTVRTHRFDIRNNQFDFLERFPGDPMPTVVSVRIMPDTAYNSKAAFYIFKPIGDLGREEHQERADRWIRQITNILSK